MKSQETKNFTLIIIVIAGINFVFASHRVSLRNQHNLLKNKGKALMKKYKVNKTYQEINEKIKSGEVVVVTAEEI
ncbi:MAG: hypothetical protein JRI92_13470, partial [Deltaproteobacteria bacterium]|nr:hypothetical protein [Deltaproteobacteria bacterium]